jgi:hypothetical protein
MFEVRGVAREVAIIMKRLATELIGDGVSFATPKP